MIPQLVRDLTDGLDESTKDVICRGPRAELGVALHKLAAIPAATRTPADSDILRAFKACSVDATRIVLIGQDPYTGPGQAMGLSFSIRAGYPVPPSLRAIYSSLVHDGAIAAAPSHGDLSSWAAQGVLMWNMSLTTEIGKSNAHSHIWRDYTAAVMRALSAYHAGKSRRLIFLLLGGDAKKCTAYIDDTHHVLTWGHPSPLNRANKTDNPLAFKYCTVFGECNRILTERGEAPIDWNVPEVAAFDVPVPVPFSELRPEVLICALAAAAGYPELNTPHMDVDTTCQLWDEPAPPTTDSLWIFTDGGCSANGREGAKASYAVYATTGAISARISGIVENIAIAGKAYTTSNNRAELTAVLYALAMLSLVDFGPYSKVIIVSDSKYSICCIDEWVTRWAATNQNGQHTSKQNLDLICASWCLLAAARDKCPVTFQHTRGHRKEPADADSHEWFIWSGNNIADKMCGVLLA